jgi:hypothetical protein
MRSTLVPRSLNKPTRSVFEAAKSGSVIALFSYESPAKAGPIEPLIIEVIAKETCVTGPSGVVCGFVAAGEEAIVVLLHELHPENTEEAATAAAPCKTWRRVSAKDRTSESMRGFSWCLL